MNTFYGHSGLINCLAYSPNKHQIASFSSDKTIRLWDTRPQQSGHDLHSHSAKVVGVRSSPGGQQIASRSEDGTVRMWNARTGQPIHILQCLDKSAWDIKYSPDGQLLASCLYSLRVYLWDVQAGILVRNLELQGEGAGVIGNFDFSPIGHQIVCGHNSGNVTIWNTQTGELIRTLHGHKAEVYCVVFSPNGDQVASYDLNGNIKVWKAQSRDLQHEMNGEVDGEVKWWGSYIVYTPDSRKIVWLRGVEQKSLAAWSAETGELCYEAQFDNVLQCVAFSPCSQQMVVGDDEGLVSVVDTEAGSVLYVFKGHTRWIADMAYSPDGRYIASSSFDKTVGVWDPESGQCLIVIPCEGGYANTLVWNASKEGHYLVTGCDDYSIRMWQIVKEDEEYQYHLKWGTRQTVLNASNARIQDIDGLSEVNRKLLVQRGAIDKQSYPLAAHEAIKSVEMPSTASKAKSASSSQVSHYREPPTKADLETEGLSKAVLLTEPIEASQSIRDYRFKYSVCSECSFAHVISCKPRK